jgi:hypothetical protein
MMNYFPARSFLNLLRADAIRPDIRTADYNIIAFLSVSHRVVHRQLLSSYHRTIDP